MVTPELFAQCLCDDFSLPHQHFVPRIVASIAERVQEYRNQVAPLEPPKQSTAGKLEPNGEGDGRALYEAFRAVRGGSYDEEEIRTDEGAIVDNPEIKILVDQDEPMDASDMQTEPKDIVWEAEEPMTVEEMMEGLPVDSTEDLRFLIKASRMEER